MTTQFPAEHFTAARPIGAPVSIAARGEYGRVFDLHPALFALTVGGYLAYLGVMAAAFMAPDLVISMAIFVLFVIAGFGTPALFARIAPPPPGRAPGWSQFMAEGFDCMTGHLSGRATAVQVLIMPALILLWGVGIAIIAATVR